MTAYLRVEYHANEYELDGDELDLTAEMSQTQARQFAVDMDCLGVDMCRVSVVFEDEDKVEVIWEDH